jgi:hypothetical protein
VEGKKERKDDEEGRERWNEWVEVWNRGVDEGEMSRRDLEKIERKSRGELEEEQIRRLNENFEEVVEKRVKQWVREKEKRKKEIEK